MDGEGYEEKTVALHIHPFLKIEILGEKQVISTDIGVSEKGMRVIHTHDTTGKLHIEAPYPHKFYLRDFFYYLGQNVQLNMHL